MGGGAGYGDGPRDDAWAASHHVHRMEFVLHNAGDVDAVARGVLGHLLGLPGVSRVGLALVEGAGRRLRFVASDGSDGSPPPAATRSTGATSTRTTTSPSSR